VLVGGRSSRMGRDKARLPFRGASLGEFVARTVEEAAGSVVLVGDPAEYSEFPFPVIADLHPGAGPLGGILTVLHHTSADWNLVVACDMPGLLADGLRRILDAAEQSGADALVPTGPSGVPEPLCAVYHRRSLGGLEAAFASGERKVTVALAGVRATILPFEELSLFQNVNTPEDWAIYGGE
jgi:molybdenum cofactor guanylyltransferase